MGTQTIYTSRPKPKRAREVWDWVVEKHGKTPKELYKNPNYAEFKPRASWDKPFIPSGIVFGVWVAGFSGNDFIHIKPEEVPCK